MQIAISFVSGLAVGLSLLWQFSTNSKVTEVRYQQQIDSCENNLQIAENKISGMLMNK